MEGARVGITSARRVLQLASALERQGARVTVGPCLGGDAPAADAMVLGDSAMLLDERPAWFVASTGVGMRLWQDIARRGGIEDELREMLASARAVARGAKAHSGLQAWGTAPVFVASRELVHDVVDWVIGHALDGEVVGIQLDGSGTLPWERLRGAGLDVLTVAPYLCVPPADKGPAVALVRQVATADLDVVTFTSPGAVRGLSEIANETGLFDEVRRAFRAEVAVAAVGVATATACEEEGYPVRVMPRRPRTGDLIRAIDSWMDRSRGSDPLRTAPLLLRPGACQVVSDRGEITLGRREYAVLAALLRRPGVACDVETLAREAWGSEGSAASATVKHQVARLRRKLGSEAPALETVRGVGYRYQPGALS